DLYEPTIAWEYGSNLIPAGHQTLNAKQAMFYSRSRKTTRDFDRGRRQREILIALKDKILSSDTLANPIKISSLIATAGSHFKAKLQISEILRLNEIARNIETNKVISTDIVEYLMSAGDGTSAYIPRSGDNLEVQRFVRSIFIDGLI